MDTCINFLLFLLAAFSFKCPTVRSGQIPSVDFPGPILGSSQLSMVSTAAFHARARGSVPGFGSLKETKMFLPHPCVKLSIVGSFRDREVACSASDRQGSNFESCVYRTVSSHSSHHPQEVLLAKFSVHKGGLKPDSFHFDGEKLRTGFHGQNLSTAFPGQPLSTAFHGQARSTALREEILAQFSLDKPGTQISMDEP